MRTLLVLFALAFALLPFDAQIALIALVKAVPREIWLGAFGASLAAMFWYSLGWNGLAERLHTEAVEKADSDLRKNRR